MSTTSTFGNGRFSILSESVAQSAAPVRVLWNVSSVIARRLVLFIGRFMLLVDDDESQVPDRAEKRGACSDHDRGRAAFDAMPLLQPAGRRQTTVNDRHAIAEPRAEPF